MARRDTVEVMAYDAIVVGAGPNGLAAGIVLAEAGRSVLLVEAQETIGGGLRSGVLTLPGFIHDICAAFHPMARASPLFRRLALDVDWIVPPAAVAHPLDDGTAAMLQRNVRETAAHLGADREAYQKLVAPFVDRGAELFGEILRPLRIPRRPLLMARFAASALPSCRSTLGRLSTTRARALVAGCAAHSMLPLDAPATTAFAIVLAAAGHLHGWPVVRGGSQLLADALAARFRLLGGEIRTGTRVASLAQLPPHRVAVLDLTPRQIARVAGNDLPQSYLTRLSSFRYGPGVFKLDWALDGPIPWRAAECTNAGTVHVGGTAEEIMQGEHEVATGAHPERPFVLVGQQSLFDSSRAPAGKAVGWAYCHVPRGSTFDMTERIEAQIERFAPGFRDRILARHPMNTADYERHDENFVDGDIGGGANDLMQILFRPFFRLDPYATPNPALFIGSSSTPPGGGVHGMCGFWAAHSALRL